MGKRTVPVEVVQAKVQEWLECIIINNTKSISYTKMKAEEKKFYCLL